jgi:raffinose/stachyose/melibiose transport system permease protein
MKLKNSTSKNLWIFLFLLPTLGIFFLLYFTPLLTAVISSFTKWNGFESMKFIGLKNYTDIFKDKRFHAALINTIKWAGYAAFVHVPFGVLVALILSRRPRGWRFVRATFMVPNIISRAALALLFLFVYKPDSGILNAIIQKIGFTDFSINWLYDPRTAFFSVTNIWLWYAAVITLITMAELMSIDPQVYESAKIDGASNFQIDLFINLPLIKRIIGTGIIIAVTSVFRMFDIIYMTTNGGPGNITTNIAVMMVNGIIHTNRYGYSNALGIILLVMGMGVMLISTHAFRMDKTIDE